MKKPKQPEYEEDNEELKHRYRIRSDLNGLVEDIISDGTNRGLFDNLKGKGKPLNLSKNFFARDQELAHNLLKENDMPPAWIMQRNDILAKRTQLQSEMEQQWAWHKRSFRIAINSDVRGRLTISWDDECLRWLEQIEEINKEIRTYNLKRPSDRLELFHLQLEKELDRIGAPRWLR